MHGSECSLFPDKEVNIHTRVESELSDLLDGGGRAVDVDDSLVDSHLKSVSGVDRVLVPLPQGERRVVMTSFLVGILTGPLTL